MGTDAGDADCLADGVEEFKDSTLRLAGWTGDDINESGDIAGAELVLRKIAKEFYLFIEF